MVRVIIESELVRTEKEFPRAFKLNDFKNRLYHVTGVEPIDMEVVVKRQCDNKEIFSIKKGETSADEGEVAGFLEREEELVVVVKDANAQSITNQLATQADAPTLTQGISEEKYLQREQSVLRWKMDHGYGRFNAALQNQRTTETQRDEAYAREQLTAAINHTCRVTVDGQAPRRAVLRYVGPLPSGATGTWCGVEFAEATGKNAGQVNGVTLFGPVAPGHASFVRPRAVEVLSENEEAKADDVHRDMESDDEI
ncbi:alf1p [Saccharomyces arboricola H-6]|uniref:Alf1p n=1 Tax=Saccharomyces arboricola (strain H-6 / AS 2.3317 / CBS 10644) TaxID=1160507 RepID=J8Q310_SACAR|nr:alf1p [Saccharomyces arboricola H-6]